MYQLYYYPMNASFAPHLVLEELGVEYELRFVDRKADAQKADDYLKLNPTGRIPTLVHDDLVLFESSAICLYLCEQDTRSRFLPRHGSSERPVFFQWLQYLTGTVQSELMLYFYPAAHTTNIDSTSDISNAQNKRLVEMFELIDDALKDKRYLLGADVTICDHFLLMLSIWADELTKPPLAFQNLNRYLVDITKRDAVQKVCEKERVDLSPYS